MRDIISVFVLILLLSLIINPEATGETLRGTWDSFNSGLSGDDY